MLLSTNAPRLGTAASLPLLLAGLVLFAVSRADATCIESNSTLNAEFAGFLGVPSIPVPGSCCMNDVCGLACPTEITPPGNGTFSF